jgi:hypothetical protein
MRRLSTGRWSAVIITALSTALGLSSWQALSNEGPSDKPHRVPLAVVDVARIFKNCRDFNAEMSRIKAEIEVFERDVISRQAEISKLVPTDAGSAPPSAADTAKAAELREKLTADVAARKKAFLAEEALVYFKYYSQVEKVAAEMAKARDIGLVLRYNSDAMDPTDRASVLQGVNRAVVYTAVPDLTGDLLAALNASKP